MKLIWNLDTFCFGLGSECFTYHFDCICRIEHFVWEREDTLSNKTHVEQVIYKRSHECELWHHQGTVILGLGNTVFWYWVTIENNNDLLKEKDDCKERRSHLMTHGWGEGFCLIHALLFFLVMKTLQPLFNLFRLVTNVKGYRRLTYIILLFDFDWKEFFIEI